MKLMQGGEHSCYPNIETIRICTQISRTMEEILFRFESGDLRPEKEVPRPRASRRRPPPTRADREAAKKGPGGRTSARKKPAGKGSKPSATSGADEITGEGAKASSKAA